MSIVCLVELVLLYLFMPETSQVPINTVVERLTVGKGDKASGDSDENTQQQQQPTEAIAMEEMTRY